MLRLRRLYGFSENLSRDHVQGKPAVFTIGHFAREPMLRWRFITSVKFQLNCSKVNEQQGFNS